MQGFVLLIILFSSSYLCNSIPTDSSTDQEALLYFKDSITYDPFYALADWNPDISFCNWTGVTCNKANTRVVELRLHNLNLQGRISPSLAELSSLFYLDMSFNYLYDASSIFDGCGQLVYLKYIDLSRNGIVGAIPPSLSTCLSLEQLHLNQNLLSGVIPPNLVNGLIHLKILNLSKNRLEGEVPPLFNSSLQLLSLSHNHLSGGIPLPICRQLGNIRVLDLSGNNLTGTIPNSIGNCTELTSLDLQSNRLSGFIPPGLMSLPMLRTLHLDHNRLEGSIPGDFGNLLQLTELSLVNNYISGEIPATLRGCQKLELLHLSANRLSGVIPEAIGNCTHLTHLDLSGNALQGPIPDAIGVLQFLEELDLSSNDLSGSVPKSLDIIKSLNYLNLSFNRLTGKIPGEWIFQLNNTVVSLDGNSGLCGPQRLSLPECPSHSHVKIVAAAVASALALIVCSLLLGFFWIQKRHRQRKDTSEAVLHKFELPIIPYEDLFDATDGFGESKLIGVGSFGSVYRGDLTDGRVVAVKVLNLNNREAHKSFKEECKVLRNVRHRNLVRVLTSCTNQHFKAIIFEFISNGSLQEHLYPQGEDDNNDCQLGLKIRLDIAIDIAHAMEYLHEEAFSQVIHRDLKPENVLLDQDMTAHVADFGIARLTSGKQSVDFLASTLTIKGSVGYIAPEYGQGGRVSSKADVYSYGILLLEILTRKRPTSSMFTKDLTLHKWVNSAFPDRLMELLDTNLFRGIVDMEMEEVDAVFKQCLISLVGLGLACSKYSPKERPSMRDVARELKSIRNSLMGNSSVSDRLKRSLSDLLNSPSRAGRARTEEVSSSNYSSSTY